MRTDSKLQKMCAAALLCAIGIMIPSVMPIRLVLEPMSFTLGSHVALFIGMFISPAVALTVALGTTLGFFLGGFPLVVVLRAASQVVFVLLGALWLKKRPQLLSTPAGLASFALVTGVVHALGEVAVCCAFYFGGMANYTDPVRVLLLLVGVGTLVHSCVDFALSVLIYKPVCRVIKMPVCVSL